MNCEDLWERIKIYEEKWRFIQTYKDLWRIVKICKTVFAFGGVEILTKTYKDIWRLMKIVYKDTRTRITKTFKDNYFRKFSVGTIV
jgi:hypothetical protein